MEPRWLLTGADFPITDLSDAALFLDPLTRVDVDGHEYMVMNVSHEVRPGRTHDWRVRITGDITVEQLFGIE